MTQSSHLYLSDLFLLLNFFLSFLFFSDCSLYFLPTLSYLQIVFSPVFFLVPQSRKINWPQVSPVVGTQSRLRTLRTCSIVDPKAPPSGFGGNYMAWVLSDLHRLPQQPLGCAEDLITWSIWSLLSLFCHNFWSL